MRGVGRLRRADGGAEQRLGQREHRVLKGRDARDDVGGGGVDGLGHRFLQARGLRVQLAVDRPHPVVLVVQPLVQPLNPGDELAVERPEGGGQAVDGGRDRRHARLVHGVQPQADLLQRAGDRSLLHDVIVHRPREQLAHSVSGGVLPVNGGRGGLAGAQQQVIVARLIHVAPSCAPAMECDHFSSSSWSSVHSLLNLDPDLGRDDGASFLVFRYRPC
ncbi:MAG: hypothetical protein ACRDNO_27935 [Trebonia sp.]